MKIEIEFSATDLKQAVAGLGKVMSRSGLPALRCARLIRDDSGNVSLSVTDLDSLATYRLRTPQEGAVGDMLIPWDLLAKATRNTKERAVFIHEKADTVVARTFIGSMSFEEPAAMPPLDEWPFIPPVTGPLHEMSATFKTAFAEAMSCSSTDSSRYVINGVCLDLTKPDAHYVVGTNGRQLYAANTFKFDLARSIIVPNRKFLAWSGFAEDGDWKLRTNLESDPKDGSWVELISDRWTIRTKLIDGDYPNWSQVFPAEESSATTVRLTREATKMLLEVVPMVRTADRGKEFACIAIQGDSLVLHSRSEADEPWKDIAIPGTSASGPAAMVLVHKEQFTHALRMGFDQIELRDPFSPTVLRAPGKQIVLGCIRGDMPQITSTEETTPSTPQPETITTENENNERKPVNITTNSERPKTTQSQTSEQPDTALRAAAVQIETVRNNFREGLNGLNQALNLLKAAEKEQRSSEREIESVRSTLRSLQRVQI